MGLNHDDKPIIPHGPLDDNGKDPTFNVSRLNEASNLRQDDLRNYSERLMGAKIERIEAVASLRAEFTKIMMEIRAEYQDKLSVAEAKRIDAIRAVDVNAVAVASQRAADQAQVLANQVVQSAEALRTLVASTAATVATSLQQFQSSLSTRITTLEQGSYQAQGKQSFSDPAFIDLLNEVKSLRQSSSQGEGRSKGLSDVYGWIIAFLGIGGGGLIAYLSK